MAEIPEEIRKQLEVHLVGIAKLFRAPLITLVVRSGPNAKGDLLLSNDNPQLVINAIRARMVERAEKFANDFEAPPPAAKDHTDG